MTIKDTIKNWWINMNGGMTLDEATEEIEIPKEDVKPAVNRRGRVRIAIPKFDFESFLVGISAE